jgi:endoglucanase
MLMRFPSDLKQVAQTIAACPTAPYHEGLVRSAALQLLHRLPHLTLRLDPFGNVIAHYRYRPHPGTALALVAHMDHPGFVGHQFLGGVSASYFKGQRVAFFDPKTGEALGSRLVRKIAFTDKIKKVTWNRPPPAGAIGMWDLPAFKFTSSHFHSRACDDLVGLSTIIALLRHLSKQRARADVYGLLTRAEEVGFQGTLAALSGRTPFPKIPVLSLETSQTQGFATPGEGPIIRVGDRTSVFDSGVTHWLQSAAQALAKRTKQFRSQRLLMGGGTCEGTPFHLAGYPTGALCLALTNYHNMGPRHKIALENVRLDDWQNLLLLLKHLATTAGGVEHSLRPLRSRLRKLSQTGVRHLKKHPLSRQR